jgi:hypothetical protein
MCFAMPGMIVPGTSKNNGQFCLAGRNGTETRRRPRTTTIVSRERPVDFRGRRVAGILTRFRSCSLANPKNHALGKQSLGVLSFWKCACPRCSSTNVRRSHRKRFERLLRILPYRCVDCDQRWYRFKIRGLKVHHRITQPSRL